STSNWSVASTSAALDAAGVDWAGGAAGCAAGAGAVPLSEAPLADGAEGAPSADAVAVAAAGTGSDVGGGGAASSLATRRRTRSAASSTIVYSAGTSTRVSSVELVRPPITTR